MDSNKLDDIKLGELAMIFFIVLVKIVVFLFAGATLVYFGWNYVLARTVTFIEPMSSFWQAFVLALILEVVYSVILYGAINPPTNN